MNIAKKIACMSLAVVGLAACTADGYYDARGNYHYNGANDNAAAYNNAHYYDANRGDNFYVDNSAVRGDAAKVPGYDRNLDPEVRPYQKAGYYDYNGYYIPYADGPVVTRAYMPPKGKCRVWFADRPAPEQPPVERCAGIQYRVPAGAYVIFGG